MNKKKRSHSELLVVVEEDSKDNMSIPDWRTFTFTTTVAGREIDVDCSVNINGVTTAQFNYGKQSYIFKLTKWSGLGWFNFFNLFLEYYKNASNLHKIYGSIDEDDEDGEIKVHQDQEQKLNCIKVAVRDIFRCLNRIVEEHERSVLDYAVDFREKSRYENTYEYYITLLTCHSIVHADFMAGNVKYKPVLLGPPVPPPTK